MRRTPILFALLLSGLANADITATAVQTVATNRTPADAPFEVKPMNAQNPGIEITYLVTGDDLAEFKDGSLKIDSVSVAKGVKLPAKIAGKITFDKFFSKISADGTYGKFSIKIPMENATDAVGSLKLKGKITVVTGSETEEVSGELAADAKEVKVGSLTVSRAESGGGFFGGDGKNLALTFAGSVGAAKEIAVFSKDGKKLESNGSMGMNGVTTRYYPADGKQTSLTVKVTVWKNMKAVEVPVVYGK